MELKSILSIKNHSIRFWITALLIFSLLLTLCISIFVSYKLTYNTLINNTLESNQGYAEKVASTAEGFFVDVKKKLQVSAVGFPLKLGNDDQVQRRLDEILGSSNFFNSVVFVDVTGKIKNIAPKTLKLQGKPFNKTVFYQANLLKGPYVSDPFIGMTDRLIVMITVPIYDGNQFLGLLAGSIYLHENNALSSILETHFYRNESYLYVVDQKGSLIYHPQPKRLGEDVTKNEVVRKVLQGGRGAERVVNTVGADMLAGYAPVESSNWGIISQTPTELALMPAKDLVKNMMLYSGPFFLLLFALSSWIAKLIVKPLNQLSTFSERLCHGNHEKPLSKISTWYKEAKTLKNAMMIGVDSLRNQINHLSVEAYTDPLTKLSNRRALKMIIEDWIQNDIPFSMVLFDIDHFKQVNDIYGHVMGDKVLQYIANTMMDEVRKNDICFRYGGEEFLILLPQADKNLTSQIAERLRLKIATQSSPIGEPITVSIGISAYPEDAKSSTELLRLTDDAMYIAKKAGKNRTVIV